MAHTTETEPLALEGVSTKALLESVREVAALHPNFTNNHKLLLDIIEELGRRLEEIYALQEECPFDCDYCRG